MTSPVQSEVVSAMLSDPEIGPQVVTASNAEPRTMTCDSPANGAAWSVTVTRDSTRSMPSLSAKSGPAVVAVLPTNVESVTTVFSVLSL